MKKNRKAYFLILLILLQTAFTQEAVGQSFRDYQATKKALSDSYYGMLDGVGSFGKGMWGLTTNTGKFLWYGAQMGYTKSKEADVWLRKQLW